MIAAVLGNSSNRYKFKEAFWGDADRGLRSYLSEASGSPQFVEEMDQKTGKVLRERKPEVVIKERPPTSHEAALKEWRAARKAFRQVYSDANAFRKAIELGQNEKGMLKARADEVARAQEVHQSLDIKVEYAERLVTDASAQVYTARAQVEHWRSQISAHLQSAPGALARLFGAVSAQNWSETKVHLQRTFDQANRGLDQANSQVKITSEGLAVARNNAQLAAKALNATRAALDEAQARVDLLRNRCAAHAVDQNFLNRTHVDLHIASPWFDEEANRQRDRVFEAAMRVHRAFVTAAAKPIRNNLDALFRTFFGRAAWSPKMRPMMPSLWSTLFMVVPVVSTTFASIERMLGFLPPEALGWLLVDEAGQAAPQAAVGAIVRSKRVVIVGDPLQIEPVTSLPTELAEMICDEFRVDPNRWSAPAASVQTVADATSELGADIPRNGSSIRVGVPLLVHRRCADPMFSLSNRIAYANLMVKMTPSRSSAIREVLGPSRWINVRPGRTEDKWSETEGQAVLELVRRIGAAGVPKLDVYIVTPFVIVAQRLRERLVASGLLAPWTDNPWEWVRDRVGTVHTVQGREADSVILVLGAPMSVQRGARAWAGGSVNLLNVAVTRTQENIYVVGSHQAWSDAGYFRSLASAVPLT